MPHHHSSAVGRPPAVNSNISRGDWVNKLNDARREWMVMLHRYQNSSSSGNDSDAPLVGKLRQDHVQTAGREARHKRDSTGTSHGCMVPAADFCLHCASIVKVELECTSEGEVIAERRRACSVCETDMRVRHAGGSRIDCSLTERTVLCMGNNSTMHPIGPRERHTLGRTKQTGGSGDSSPVHTWTLQIECRARQTFENVCHVFRRELIQMH